MQFLINLFQKNCCKFSIGLELFNYVKKETNLLINEDVILLQSAFDSQSELQKITQFQDSKSSNSIWFHICLPIVLAALSTVLFNDYYVYFALLSSITFLIILISTFFKKASTRNFEISFKKFIQQIDSEKRTWKKLKELIDDNSNNGDIGQRLKALEKCFRDTGIKCLSDFRNQTLVTKDKLPLKNDIDDNLISSLPDDLYDSYNDEDSLSPKGLKSLRQLIRLQISEYLKRFLLLFVQNYYQDPSQFDVSFFPQSFVAILNLMIENSLQRQTELLSTVAFYKSFYDTKLLSNQRNLEENECSELWQACRNIRKTIFRSIAILEECEHELDNSLELDDNKSDLIPKLEILYDDFGLARDIISNIQKKLQRKVIPFVTKNLESPIGKAQTESAHPNLFIELNGPPKDEVFEAFIEDQAQTEVRGLDDFDIESEDMKNAENNVFSELKMALKEKAIEHRIREAKAQGLETNREKIEQDYLESVELRNQIQLKTTLGNFKDIPSDSVEANRLPSLNFDFNFNFALNAVNQTQKLVIEETFGDDSGEESTN